MSDDKLAAALHPLPNLADTVPCQWDEQPCAIPATRAARTTCPRCTTARTYCGAHMGLVQRLLTQAPRRCRGCGAKLTEPYVTWRNL